MRNSKATMRFLPALVLVLLAVLPAYLGSLWTGVASLALASDAPAAKPDGTTAAPTAGQNATAGTTTTTPAAADAGIRPQTRRPLKRPADAAAANTDAGASAAAESNVRSADPDEGRDRRAASARQAPR